MRKPLYWRSVILTTVSIVVVVAFFYYLYVNIGKYRDLLHMSVTGVFAMFFLTTASLIINGASTVHLLRNMDIPLSYWDGFFLTTASTLANQLPISGGIISKGLYLKRLYNISYTWFFSATMLIFLCYISVSGVIGMSVLLYWVAFKVFFVSPILLICFFLMAACFLLILYPLERIEIPEKIYAWILPSIEGWTFFSKKYVFLLQQCGLLVLLVLFLSARYWLAFRMLSQNITFGQAMLLSSASVLTQLVSIAPGGLGVRELIVGSVMSMLGGDLGVSVVAVGLDRLISTFEIFLVGGISVIIVSKQISDTSVAGE